MPMRPMDEPLRAALGAFGLGEGDLGEDHVARLLALVRRWPDDGRSSFGALLFLELQVERERGAEATAALALRVAERIAKRAQRDATRRHAEHQADVDVLPSMADAERQDAGPVEGVQHAELWSKLAGTLDADDLALLHQRIVEQRSTATLAAERGISRSQLNRRLRALLDRLARILEPPAA
jgi:hypothetical protein